MISTAWLTAHGHQEGAAAADLAHGVVVSTVVSLRTLTRRDTAVSADVR